MNSRMLLCIAALLSMTLGACTDNSGLAEQVEMNRQLLARVQKLEDTMAIQKLQSKYVHYLFTQRYDRIADECYSRNSPDVSVEFSDSGVYRGPESIRKLYAAFEATRQIPGFFIMHTTVNPYIEIAADGMSAKAHWLSPGASGSDSSASWIWGPYYIEYVKEDGQWRILHSNLAPLFRNKYEVSWAQAAEHGSVKGPLKVEPDEPTTQYKPYNEVKKTTDIFRNWPDLPQAY